MRVQAKRSDGTLPPHVTAYLTMALCLFVDDDYEESRDEGVRGVVSARVLGCGLAGAVVVITQERCGGVRW